MAGKFSLMTVGCGLGTIAITASLIGLAFTTAAAAQEKMLRTLTVTGRGTELVATTLSQVRLGVEVQGKTAEEVQREAARRSSAVVALLRSRNVDKLETTGINLNPTYRYDNGTQTLTGYSASNIVSFRIETAKTGTLLDDAVKAGATRIDSVSFVAADAVIVTARQQALREATQDAQGQADTVLDSLGLSRREIVGIQINNAVVPPPQPLLYQARAKGAEDAATPVIGGEQEVEAAVTLQISY